jgi:MFS family permease
MHGRPHLSIFQLMGLMMHAFGYGLFYASVGVLLLPQEALHMFEEQHAIFLAVMLALAGMSQLVSPAAGYWSDRTCHWMGRRMPYILLGNLVLFLCMGAMFLARTYMYGYTYLLLLLVAVIALNVAYTGFTGLVSDVVPSTQMDFASGVMGALTAAGAVSGLIFLGELGEERLYLAYGVYAGLFLASVSCVRRICRSVSCVCILRTAYMQAQSCSTAPYGVYAGAVLSVCMLRTAYMQAQSCSARPSPHARCVTSR